MSSSSGLFPEDVCILLATALHKRVIAHLAQHAAEGAPDPVVALARDLIQPASEENLLLLAGNDDYYVHEVSIQAANMLEEYWPGIVVEGGDNVHGELQYMVFFEPPIEPQRARHQD